MDALEKRVLDRIGVERRELQAAQVALTKRRVKVAKEAERHRKAASALFDALQAGDRPTAKVLEAGSAALKALARLARELLTVNDLVATQAATLATLEDPAEKDRRMARAKDLGLDDKPLTGIEAAEIVLLRDGRPRHVTDLTREVLETGTVKLTGKTPAQTMSAYMAKEAAKPDGKFVRLAPGVFDLRHREPVAAS